jgi:outer membrane immunogenic protein
MKRIAIVLLVGVAAVASLGYSASAADLAVPPPPPPPPSWTGFYIGAHAGAAWQQRSFWSWTQPDGFFDPLDINRDSGGPALGAVGGFQAGYNWQFAPAWVAGIEGDISWASLSDQRTVGPLTRPGLLPILPHIVFPNTSVSMTANTEWLSSVRGRLGFVGWWNTMFYATGGVAWANIEYSAKTVSPPVFPPNLILQGWDSSTSFNTTKTGWVVGGGAEWMATTNILLRAEYLYYNINNGDVSASAPYSPPPIAGAATLAGPPNYSWSRYNVQVFRLAASYKF